MRHLSLRHHFILRNTSVAGPAVAAAVSWVPPCGCTTAIFMSSIHSPLSPQPPSCPQFYFPQKHQAGFLRIFLFIEALPKSTAQGLLLSSWAVLWLPRYMDPQSLSESSKCFSSSFRYPAVFLHFYQLDVCPVFIRHFSLCQETGGRTDKAHEKSHENPLTSLMLTCDPKGCQGRKIASRLKIDAHCSIRQLNYGPVKEFLKD